MKADEIKKCAICGKGVMHCGIPLFYHVTIRSMGIDMAVVKTVVGLETMMGNVAVARALSPDPDVAKQICEPTEVLVCQPCAVADYPLLLLVQEGE